MKLITWLVGRAPDIDTPPPPPPIISTVPPRAFPSPDIPDADEIEHPDETGTIPLEEVYSIIDYVDAKGVATRRRITMRKVARGPIAPVLTAICHERRAIRNFRCDRIECFIDDDGVAETCRDFFRDVLSVDLDELAPPSTDQPPAVATADTAGTAFAVAREIREHLRPALSVLVTAANCDGEFHPEELDAICQYIERELMSGSRCRKFRDHVTIDVLDQLTDLVRKMRPSRPSLPDHLQRLAGWPDDDYALFVRALEHVIVADGTIAAEEADFLEDIAGLRDAVLHGITSD